MSRSVRFLVGAVAAVLTLSGCGGTTNTTTPAQNPPATTAKASDTTARRGGKLSREEAMAKADEVCKRIEDRMYSEYPSDSSKMGDYFRSYVGWLREMADEVTRMAEQSGVDGLKRVSDALYKMADAMDARITDLEADANALNDDPEFKKLSDELTETVKELGLKVCGRKGRSGSSGSTDGTAASRTTVGDGGDSGDSSGSGTGSGSGNGSDTGGDSGDSSGSGTGSGSGNGSDTGGDSGGGLSRSECAEIARAYQNLIAPTNDEQKNEAVSALKKHNPPGDVSAAIDTVAQSGMTGSGSDEAIPKVRDWVKSSCAAYSTSG